VTGGAKLRIGLVQMRSGVRQAANIEAMETAVRKAAAAGAHYVQTPEVTGLVQRDRAKAAKEISPDAGNPVFAAAARVAAETGVWLHIGSTAVAVAGGKAFNRGALFAPDGARVAIYDKIHLFDVDLPGGESWRESASIVAGDAAVVADLPAARLGMAICYDLRFPALFRAQAQAGAAILTCPACFTRQTGQAHWHALLRARAIENGAFVLAAAQGGRHEDGRESFGHSLVVNPWGEIVAELDHDRPDVLVADLALGESGAARSRIPALEHDRHFTVHVATGGGRTKGAA
jgi:predicted amidohydrolase